MKRHVCKFCGTRKKIEDRHYGYGVVTVSICEKCGSWSSHGEKREYVYVCNQEGTGAGNRLDVQDNEMQG